MTNDIENSIKARAQRLINENWRIGQDMKDLRKEASSSLKDIISDDFGEWWQGMLLRFRLELLDEAKREKKERVRNIAEQMELPV